MVVGSVNVCEGGGLVFSFDLHNFFLLVQPIYRYLITSFYNFNQSVSVSLKIYGTTGGTFNATSPLWSCFTAELPIKPAGRGIQEQNEQIE